MWIILENNFLLLLLLLGLNQHMEGTLTMRKSGKDGRLCQKCDEVNIQGVDRLTVQSYSGPRSGASRLVLTLTFRKIPLQHLVSESGVKDVLGYMALL